MIKMEKKELGAYVEKLNEKYKVSNLPRTTFYVGTFEKMENEVAAAALVEYWHRQGKITAVSASDFGRMLETDTKAKEEGKKVFNPILEQPPFMVNDILCAYKGGLTSLGLVEIVKTDDGEVIVPQEKLLDAILAYGKPKKK